MTAIEAMRLSLAHNLGSARNTLAPGLELPAYTTGMDPNVWSSRIQAMSLSRLQPAGFATSQYKFQNTPGSFDFGAPTVSNALMVPKTDLEKQQAIQSLMSVMAPAPRSPSAGGSSADFGSGTWLFGNDFGGLQSAFLASAAQDEAARAARVREAQNQAQLNLTAQAQAQDRAMRQQAAQQALKQSDFQNMMSLAGLSETSGQHTFEDQLNLMKLTGANMDAEQMSKLGTDSIMAQFDAATKQQNATSGFNDHVQSMVNAYNDATTGEKIGLTMHNGVLVPSVSKGDAGGTKLISDLYSSPAYAAITDAQNAVTKAQADYAKLAFVKKASTGLMPSSMPASGLPVNPILQNALQRYGVNLGGVAPRTATAVASSARSGATPFILQDQAAARGAAQAAWNAQGVPPAAWQDGIGELPFGANVAAPAATPRTYVQYVPGSGDQIAPSSYATGVTGAGGGGDIRLPNSGGSTPGSIQLSDGTVVTATPSIPYSPYSPGYSPGVSGAGGGGNIQLPVSSLNGTSAASIEWTLRQALGEFPGTSSQLAPISPEQRAAAIAAYLQAGGVPWWPGGMQGAPYPGLSNSAILPSIVRPAAPISGNPFRYILPPPLPTSFRG
jgi:hypothetical protein